MHTYSTYWHRLFSHWQKDFKAFIYLVFILFIARLTLLCLFHKQLQDGADLTSFLLCFHRGFQFDARVVTTLLAPSFCLAVFTLRFWAQRYDRYLDTLRLGIGSLFIVLTLVLSVINTAFFEEYHEQFNHWIFGILFDDRKAIWGTIYKTYPLFKLLILSVNLSVLFIYGLKCFIRKPFCDTYAYHPSVVNRFIQGLLIASAISLFVGGLRGSFGNRPLQNIDIAITKDSLLNRIVVNSYFALVYAVYDHQTAKSNQSLEHFWPSKRLEEALAVLQPAFKPDQPLLDAITQEAPGPVLAQPQQVFIIVMESQDTWPMLDAYQSLGLNPSLKAIAEEGFWVRASVSSGSGTLPSLSTFITGLPFVGVFPNFHPLGTKPYPTALAPIFKELGYKANFFYGGYLSWQRIEAFCKNQGFDASYGGSLMGPWENNEWGVNDQQLFDFVLKALDPTQPSLNLILTTSNHPPYNIDLAAEGCPLPVPTADLPWDRPVEPRLLKILAHGRYADTCIGNFIRQAKERFPNALFVITGDHWSRRFIHTRPSLYESRSVPIIFYAPGLGDFKSILSPLQVSASHLDIVRTIADLCAPAGFRYCALGKNILDPAGSPASFGAGVILTPSYIFAPQAKAIHAEMLPHASLVPPHPQLDDSQTKAFSLHYKALQAVGWWLTTQGTDLP